MGLIDEAQWLALQRMAVHCAATYPGPAVLPHHDRVHAALDGIVGHLAEHGWDSDKDLFRAGTGSIGRASDEAVRHLAHRWAWMPVANDRGQFEEDVIDRIAARQLLGALTPGEREAVLEAADAGGRLPRGPLTSLLYRARVKARRLWVAPGETPHRHSGRQSKAQKRRYHDAEKVKLWDQAG